MHRLNANAGKPVSARKSADVLARPGPHGQRFESAHRQGRDRRKPHAEEAAGAFDSMMSGGNTSQMACLMALRRAETVDEITGAVTTSSKMLGVKAPPGAVDVVVPGGRIRLVQHLDLRGIYRRRCRFRSQAWQPRCRRSLARPTFYRHSVSRSTSMPRILALAFAMPGSVMFAPAHHPA
jgi:hypothetical protein